MKRIYIFMSAALFLLAYSCKNDDLGLTKPDDGNGIEVSTENPDQPSKIGAKLPNPYAVATMKKAYRNLTPTTRSIANEDDIVTTHLYIKFLPSNEDELKSLSIQNDLDLYLVPLDCEFTDGWSEVDHDYSINGYQHRWCSVPVERDLSNIECPYEVLEELYIPDDFDSEGANLTRAASHLPEVFIDALVEEAYTICGIELEPIVATRATAVYPSGTILAWDTTFGRYVGNEGMKVRAVRGFKTSSGFCNSSGYYKCDKSFKYNWNYHMHFDRADFEIREGSSTSEIVYNKHKMHGPWNYTFVKDSKEAFWSVCFRAAYHYYYKSIDVRRPPENTFWKAKLAVECYNSQGDGVAGSMSRRGRFILATRPVLKMYHKSGNTTYYPYNQIYGCAIHELAHAAHWGFDKKAFEDATKIVKESYANGIEVYLTKKIYSGYDTWYNRGRYTGMMRDLTDVKTGTAQTVTTSYHQAENDVETDVSRSYVDRASGYTMRELEDAMIGCKTWTQWRDKIKSKYPSKTSRQYVDEVFTYWDTK